MLNKHSLVSIIDADTIAYLVAYRAKDEENADIVLTNTDNFIQLILTNTSCTHYIAFLGSGKCFRHEISATYKANRPESPDWYKKWGGVIKAHLRDKWKFQIVKDIEADDAVSMIAWSLREKSINYIVCGADKDLLQIEGNHYNIRTHTRSYISKQEALRNLYKQILLGDVADNIKGCKGIGKKKASQFIDGLVDELQMSDTAYNLFINKYEEVGDRLFKQSLELCKLLDVHNPFILKLDYIEVPRVDIPNSMDSILTELFG